MQSAETTVAEASNLVNFSESDSERFWSKVKKTDECWVWLSTKNKQSYGVFAIKRKSVKAHRISWEIKNGKIPDRIFVLHKCDNPQCVNPDHLFLGSAKDNTQDMLSKGRNRNAYGEKHGSKTHP